MPKKIFRRELLSTRYLSGMPKTSMMHASCSFSVSPGLSSRRSGQSENAGPRNACLQDWVAGMKLRENAAQAPHVDRHVIIHPENDSVRKRPVNFRAPDRRPEALTRGTGKSDSGCRCTLSISESADAAIRSMLRSTNLFHARSSCFQSQSS